MHLLPGDGAFELIRKDILQSLYPGKHRIIIGYKNSIYYYYSIFEVVENDSNLAKIPTDYDRHFLMFTPPRYVKDKLTEDYHPVILEENGLDIIEIKNQPINTEDKCITFNIDFENKEHTYWRDFYFETKIDGQWYTLAIYEPSNYNFSNGNLKQYIAFCPNISLTVRPVAELTLEKVSLHKIWDPAGPFAGRHRLWGRLILEDGSTIVPYAEFDIEDAANAAHAGTSAWAEVSVRNAIFAGLVPPSLQGNYQQPITRAEFTALTIAFMESATESSAAELLREKNLIADEGVFSDTDDANVLAAYALGIVEGLGGGIFDPHANINREQFATMLARTQAVLDGDISPAKTSTYADRNLFSPWATPSIDLLTEQGIMGGMGDNRFNPKGYCTREQAIVTFWRMIEK